MFINRQLCNHSELPTTHGKVQVQSVQSLQDDWSRWTCMDSWHSCQTWLDPKDHYPLTSHLHRFHCQMVQPHERISPLNSTQSQCKTIKGAISFDSSPERGHGECSLPWSNQFADVCHNQDATWYHIHHHHSLTIPAKPWSCPLGTGQMHHPLSQRNSWLQVEVWAIWRCWRLHWCQLEQWHRQLSFNLWLCLHAQWWCNLLVIQEAIHCGIVKHQSWIHRYHACGEGSDLDSPPLIRTLLSSHTQISHHTLLQQQVSYWAHQEYNFPIVN